MDERKYYTVEYSSAFKKKEAGHGGSTWRLRQKDCKFKASLGYIVSSGPA
jgi:hypothetical protein